MQAWRRILGPGWENAEDTGTCGELHHGVLSEDAIWNLLEWQRELMEDIRDGVGL